MPCRHSHITKEREEEGEGKGRKKEKEYRDRTILGALKLDGLATGQYLTPSSTSSTYLLREPLPFSDLSPMFS
jgi:hypothetical protein